MNAVSEQSVDAADDAWIRWFNQSVTHFNAGRRDEAVASLSQAAALRPDEPRIWLNLGVMLRESGRRDQALQAFESAHRLRADHPDTLSSLGTLLLELGRLEPALAVLRRLVALQPDYPQAAFLLGNGYMGLDQAELAEIAYRLAMIYTPDLAVVVNNLGAALMSQRRLAEAATLYRRAIRLAPESAEYHKNLGTCRLTAGDFEEGGREYEWRSRQPRWQWNRSFPGKPVWQGGPLSGQTILVHFEQGLGDSFQYSRYLPVLKAMGARTIFECQRSLKRVLSSVPGIDQLVAQGEPLPDFDCYIPLMSLPYRCGTTPATVPGGEPYLTAEAERVAYWRGRMGEGEFRIGINWHANDGRRSIPLEHFAALARIPGVRLYSLQQVVGLDQLERWRDQLGIVDWSAEMDTGSDGFVDSAAVMANLDLIISCDSAINHLAGAMGRQAFLVLRWFGDWRWMDLPDHSPWYPNTRLFRMERKNDWPGVMARVTAAAAQLAA